MIKAIYSKFNNYNGYVNVFKNFARSAIVFIFLSGMFLGAHAQDLKGIDVVSEKKKTTPTVEIAVVLEKRDWTYDIGEEAVFVVKAYKNGIACDNEKIQFEIGPEKMQFTKRGEMEIKGGEALISGGTMQQPGFLRCEVKMDVDGNPYSARATAAFAPEEIKPTVMQPKDFSVFWHTAMQKSKSVPLHKKLTLLEDRATEDVNVYQVEYEFLSENVEKFYAVLCIPKKEGKYPAIIRFPGAGWAPLSGDKANSAKGFITLDLYIHGKPVTESQAYYEDLKNNELKDYMYKGIDNRDSFYYHNVLLGCRRAVDLIYELPNFDGENLGAWGSSQGGALSIITTALDKRIDYFVALCPAMCDFSGYLYERAGGWPHFFLRPELYEDKEKEVLEALSYYDVVNFATHINVPGFFSWGFNDATTPPTSFYAAYNMVQAPKQTFVIPEGEHKIYPPQRQKTYNWLMDNLRKNKASSPSET
ncbi:acetylxylan esterase [Sphingobacterium arenae]|uniref:Acetylxylan esterase n=1 Tax=Sphingobacterium arenae TaxID=1280598 RepID=A0ABR7Y2J1_9SPHI|nr:acetylxylan esterase [Sphingobacterium arenae]MBD1425520.1 acetylxylan esterase [Sphingobacterium arenae]